MHLLITPENFLQNNKKYAYTVKGGVVYSHNNSNDGRRSLLLRMGSGRRRCRCVVVDASCDIIRSCDT